MPALARQAELAGTNHHRPGTLPAHELRTLLGQQAQLTTTLTQLRTDLTELPGDHTWTVEQRESAQAELAATRGRLQDAADTLAQFDRPFRRRGHEAEIRNAHHTAETPPGHGNPTQPNPTQLHNITDRLTDDRRRGARRQPPGRIIDTLGRRPHEAKPGRTWDIAAGQLDQHQTAYGLSRGLGSTKGPKLPLEYLFSRSITQQASRAIEQAIGNERQLTQGIEGPSLGIGR